MVSRIIRALALILLARLGKAQSSPNNIAPVEIQWSNTTYGPDGPWYALSVQIGSPPQTVDLFPAVSGPSNILSTDYCLNYTLGNCHGTANYFDQNASHTYDSTWYWQTTGNPTWELPLASSGTFGTVTDMYSIPVKDALWLINNASMHLLSEGEVTIGENQFSTYYTLGTFSIGSTTTGFTLPNENAPFIGNYSVNYAYQNASRIPSASFALQCGSVTAGVSPVLHFGGYDQSRVVGQPISTVFQGDDAIIGLKDISIGSFYGASPWNYTGNVQSGFLQTNVSGGKASNTSLSTYVSPDQPFIVMPPETCDAIASQLPVTLDPTRDLYFWDTNNASYSAIINGPHYLGFTLTDPEQIAADANVPSPGDIEIKVPFKLLNLTLEPAIQQPNVPARAYFPCYRYTRQDWVQWRLGRAFMQAAYYVGNWVPHAPGASNPVAGGWSLAQAPGPHMDPPRVTALSAEDYTITPGYTADQLAGTWGFYAPGAAPPPSAPPPPPSGLSAGAKAGIAVGVVVAVLLIGIAAYVLYRRRQRQARIQRAAELASGKADFYVAEKSGVGAMETALLDSRSVEAQAAQLDSKSVAEMPVQRERQELPGSGLVLPPVSPKDGEQAL